jgi:hypothetical protein
MPHVYNRPQGIEKVVQLLYITRAYLLGQLVHTAIATLAVGQLEFKPGPAHDYKVEGPLAQVVHATHLCCLSGCCEAAACLPVCMRTGWDLPLPK